jgi:hypothetical protein
VKESANVTEMSTPNETVLLVKAVEGSIAANAAALMPPWGPEKIVERPGLAGAETVAVAERVLELEAELVGPPPLPTAAMAGSTVDETRTSADSRPIPPRIAFRALTMPVVPKDAPSTKG